MRNKIDRISGATTHDPAYIWRPGSRKAVPANVVKFLAQHGVAIPAAGHVDITEIDKALAGRSITDRIAIKQHLRACDIIAA
jgi:hypothetical protein